ncbi:MAG: hypothetical protein ABI867_31150 [Kofleriaceae bacterium]
MRSVAALAIAAWVVGCGDDPSIEVHVSHPPATLPIIDHTSITVYESEASNCGDIEFSVLTGEQLAALEVAVLVIDDRGTPIDGALKNISRTGRKLIVARGFAADGTLRTAGCSPHDEIFEHDTQDVETVDVATISIGGIVGGDSGFDVTVTDPDGVSIRDRDVAWRVYGPAGTSPLVMDNTVESPNLASTWQPSTPACSNADGRLRMHPTPPGQLGGFAFDVRASWASAPPQLFSSFTKILPALHVFTPPDDRNARWCAVRATATERNLVCLEKDATGEVSAVRHTITAVNGAAVFAAAPEKVVITPKPPAGNVVIAIVDVDRGNDLRDVYAVTSRGEVIGLFSPSVPLSTPVLAETVADVMVEQACEPGQRPRLLLNTGVTMHTIKVMEDLQGPAVPLAGGPTLDVLDFNNTGCVTELDPTKQGVPVKRQVAVLDLGRTAGGRTQAHFACNAAAGNCVIDLPIPRAGVGFIEGPEARMVGAFFDASGAILSSWVLLPDAQKQDRLVEKERMAAASFPQHIATGLVDADADADLVWTIFNANLETTNFQVAYARPIGTDRLTALSGQQDLIANHLIVADVTGEGNADLVVTGASDVLGTTHGVIVIPAHVTVPIDGFQADAPCAH